MSVDQATEHGAHVRVVRLESDDATGASWQIRDVAGTWGWIFEDRYHPGWFQVIGAPWPDTANLPTWALVTRLVEATFVSVVWAHDPW